MTKSQNGVETKTLIKQINKFLKDDKFILFAYLFGSRAGEDYNSKSDVDVAVYLDEKEDNTLFKKRIELISGLSKILKKDVDIIILNKASLFLKYVILREGRLIYDKAPSKRIDFELKSTNEYFDFKPYLDMYHQRTLINL